VDGEQLMTVNQRLNESIAIGKYDEDTLYILENDKAMSAIRNLNKKIDLLANINGFNVLAPGWLQCTQCPAVPFDQWIENKIPYFQMNQAIIFSRATSKLLPFTLLDGWAYPESWGVWSNSQKSKLFLIAPKGASKLKLDFRAYVLPTHPTQSVEILINGIFHQKHIFNIGENNSLEIPLKIEKNGGTLIAIDFRFQNPARPVDLGYPGDDRLLSIGLMSGKFE
jgi:hypothetical protein